VLQFSPNCAATFFHYLLFITIIIILSERWRFSDCHFFLGGLFPGLVRRV